MFMLCRRNLNISPFSTTYLIFLHPFTERDSAEEGGGGEADVGALPGLGDHPAEEEEGELGMWEDEEEDTMSFYHCPCAQGP